MELSTVFTFIGSLGGSEILLVLLAVLLLFGAKKIPELARGLGKGIREFKDASKEVQKEWVASSSEAPNKE
jgi:sec-independent protein translocase protein TatA